MEGNLLKTALARLQTDKHAVMQKWQERLNASLDEYACQPIGDTLEDWLDALLEDIADGSPDRWDSLAHSEAARLVAKGIHEDYFRLFLGGLSTVLWDYAMEEWTDSPAVALHFLRQVDAHIIRGRTEMAGVFLDKRMEMITKQQQAIIELSTPVIPLLDNILIVPVIGTIDTNRANQIMENILCGITEREAEIVIIDITGVHIVDSTVANHLIKAYQAAGLLGAKCIMVGIRPEVAQTIVQLDLTFAVDTKNTLAQGIEYALQLQGKKIVNACGSEVK